VISTSNSVSISAINSSGFFHGYIQFDINFPVKSGETFTVALTSSGYTFAEGAYVGWVRTNVVEDYLIYTPTYGPPNLNMNSPLDMQMWERKDLTRGIIT